MTAMRLRSAIAAITVLLAVTAPTAGAHWRPPATGQITQAFLPVAEDAWRDLPGPSGDSCPGQTPTVVPVYADVFDLPAEYNLGGWQLPPLDGWADRNHCRMLVAVQNDPVRVCMTMVHEDGHLRGHEHGEGPIMGRASDGQLDPAFRLPGCVTAATRLLQPQTVDDWRESVVWGQLLVIPFGDPSTHGWTVSCHGVLCHARRPGARVRRYIVRGSERDGWMLDGPFYTQGALARATRAIQRFNPRPD